MNREMYRSREAFNIHATQKHKTPSSVLDQIKVAQFALKEEWFENDDRTISHFRIEQKTGSSRLFGGTKINNMPNMASRKFPYIPKVLCAA